MSRYRKITTICCAAVFALGLSACGGGDDGISVADRDAAVNDAVDAEKAKTDALQMQIDALRAQLDLDPAGDEDLGDSIKDLQDEVTRLQGLVQAAADKDRMEQEDADRMAAAKTGKELFAALGGPTDGNALGNVGASDTNLSNGLTVDAANGAGTLTTDPDDVTLKAGADAGSLGNWSGMNYAHAAAGTKVMNEAVIYNNKGPGRTRSFKDLGHIPASADSGVDFKGYITLDETHTPTLARIGGDAFEHSGTQTYTYTADAGKYTTRGTYDGAPGEYRCTSPDRACAVTNDGKGGPSELVGVWHFKPDDGANAMAHQADAAYLYYGWWVSKDKNGMPTAASAFTGVSGTLPAGTMPTGTNAPDMLTGSAMYAGHAAGKFALDYSKNKLLDGASDGGHFTADVMLSAKFGPNATPNNGGISGTIDNFMANGESVPWSVALHRAAWGNEGAFKSEALVAGDGIGQGTTWSIDGTSAPESGEWGGQMYDEMPGNAPTGDGSNIPTTVTGTFYSVFESVGRMVGAFGANKQ